MLRLLLVFLFSSVCGLHIHSISESSSNSGEKSYLVGPSNMQPAPYAEWAHHHWVWLSAKEANRTTMEDLVTNYLSRNITVGAVDLDSGWSTGYNNFKFDETQYPNPKEMIQGFHDKGVRVILWATSMIDTDCDLYAEAHSKGYFLKDVLNRESKPLKWWHGEGGLLDYSNPDALMWWHKQLDRVLSLGIDGWKCDGTDPYIMEIVFARGYHGRHISFREYADSYYGDFFFYTQEQLGNDRLIMSRPVDSFGPVFISYSPKDVMFSGWTGDLDSTWKGLWLGLERMKVSSERGYLNFGTDIGGYRGCGGGACRELALYIRWFQLGALCPLMENGGNDDHQPWKYDQPQSTYITDIYRDFVNFHYSLVPYLLTTGAQRYTQQRSSMQFVTRAIGDFRYLLGDNIFVAPFKDNSTKLSIEFPGVAYDSWMYWWNNTVMYHGGAMIEFECPYTQFPVFQLRGSIVPLSGAYADASCDSTKDVHRSVVGRVAFPDGDFNATAQVREFNGTGLTLSYVYNKRVMTLSCSAHDRRVTFVLKGASSPVKVLSSNGDIVERRLISTGGGCASNEEGLWWHHNDVDEITVHMGDNALGSIVTLHF